MKSQAHFLPAKD